MNLHAPQSVEAATELREIAAVPLQIVSPRESVPIVSVVQDTLVGANRFARSETLFTKKEAMNLLVHAKAWNGVMPEAAITEPQKLWTGQQLLSCLLPPVTLSMKNNSDQVVEIHQGQINPTINENGEEKPNGRLDKKVFSKQLLHIIYNDYGPDVTVNFLDSLQAMIANFLMNNGFSVGISDLIADDDTMAEIRKAMNLLTNSIETQILQIHTGLFENTSGRTNQEEFEGKVMGTLNKAVGDAGKIGLKSLADTNRMTNMVKAGSKGSDVNVSQMIAVLGQQAIEGKRVPNGFQHRTLPHFKRFDDSARARGFIASSYITGLQPDEFFFHAMSGREGLIDTAVKTADTGYMQRRIRVALEDLITQHDGSVRDTTGGVLQLSYGEDGINATKLEEQRLPIDGWDDAKLAEHYVAEGAAGAAAYLEAAKNDRRILVEKVCGGRPNPMVRAPVHMERMIFRVRDQFGFVQPDGSVMEGTVTAEQVLEAQTAVLRRTHVNNHVWSALVRHYMSPKFMKRNGFTKDALDALVEQIVVKHWRAWVEPGQPVGVLAAQSIGEPATQMTLNTFHLAGVAAKSNMTRGVPRLKELLTATKNPKAVELTIPLRRDLRDKKEEARRVAQQLEFTLLQDLVTTARIYFDPYDEATMVTADQEWMAYQRAFESQVPEEDQRSRSPWLLRIELDRDRMFAKNITMDDIAFILNSAAENNGHSAGLHMLYTDYNATQLVFRMRLNSADPAAAKKGKAAKPYVDDLEQLKIIQNKILANTAIRGLAGLRSVNYQKNTDLFEFAGDRYKRVEQYVLISDGSNFLEVLTHPDVDPTRIVSSSVHDMLENLGIEATRATLFKEITSLFAESGTNVNYRHVCILVDRMCHKGRLMSVDRYGINKNDIGPLAKMSFEQTEDIALRAAQFGERDPVQGVSAKVMLGAPIRAGTAFTDLLFDEQAAVKLAQSTPEQIVKPVRRQVITADEMNEVTYGDMGDRGECGNIVDAMRSNITLPPNKLTAVIEEPDAEVDLLIVDE
jgi:DNA-directed RNA polymerase II subunit RPB1